MINKEYALRLFNTFVGLLTRGCLIFKNDLIFAGYLVVLAAYQDVV
jgi:hypothetical protein